jgi:hypothetical protein
MTQNGFPGWPEDWRLAPPRRQRSYRLASSTDGRRCLRQAQERAGAVPLMDAPSNRDLNEW